MHLSEPTRAYLYRLILAGAAIALVYRWGTADQIDVWRALAEALLTLPAPALAARNTSTKGPACAGCDDNAPHGQNPELIDDLEVR